MKPHSLSKTFFASAIVFVLGILGSQATLSGEIALAYDDYGAVLRSQVNERGMVNYRGLKANSERLQAFVQSLAQVDEQVYQKWDDPEKIAFWINAYNALTLVAIIDHYPIKAPLLSSSRFVYPANSTRQIPGVWDNLRFAVMGRRMTLDEIEHQVLRKQFNEPRIHMALVCAALGCPPLRNEPYVGVNLTQQLNDQTRHFLGNPEKFRIDRGKRTVYLSPIFKWFGVDFVKTYGTDKKFQRFGREERAALNFVASYLNTKDQEYLLQGGYTIAYLSYDWSLNEQAPR